MDSYLFLPRCLDAALFDVALASAAGLAIIGLWLPGEWDAEIKLRRGLTYRALTMLLALICQAFLLTASIIGSSRMSDVGGQAAAVLTGTHSGRVLLMSGTAALILFTVSLVTRGLRPKIASVWLLAALTILLMTRAAAGHAADEGDFTLPEVVQFLHLASTATWSGGIMAAGFLLAPRMLRAEQLEAAIQFLSRLSRVVTAALALIVLTGLYNSYRGVGTSLSLLIGTQWGRLLVAKVALVCVAMLMGGYNRLKLRQTHTAKDLSGMAVVLRAEAIVMLLILTLSAFLAASPTPG